MSDPYGDLLRELGRVQRENRKLRRRVFLLTASRDYWRTEAGLWKRSALHNKPKAARKREAVSATERAEAS